MGTEAVRAAKSSKASTGDRSGDVLARSDQPKASSAGPHALPGSPGAIPVHPTPWLQRKLSVGSDSDPLERDADQAAQRVMRMSDPDVAPAPTSGHMLQRKCAACRDDEESTVRTKVISVKSLGDTGAPPIVEEVLGSRGRPMEAALRGFFEPRFGADFGCVRLHTDPRAADSAAAIGALAYTVGNHVVFGPGQIPSDSGPGGTLLAHELAHVVQQGGAESKATGRTSGPLRRTTSPLLQRATRRGCVAPSFVVDFATASLFGTLAETLIEADYMRRRGGTPFGDVFLDNPLGPMAYIAFLAAHHPHLNRVLLAGQIGLSGGILVPDILDTRGAREFYEIKPDSPDGRAAGRGKIAAIEAFMAFNALPYLVGSSYTPTPSLPIPLSGSVLTAAITTFAGPAAAAPLLACGPPVATLAPRRTAAGLIVYEICVEADLDCYLRVLALEALIAAVILAALATDGASLPETAPAVAPLLAL